MNVSIISFTDNGSKLNKILINKLKLEGFFCIGTTIKKYASKYKLLPLDTNLNKWVNNQFNNSDLIIFISACGIAVRSIAPFIKDKFTDPAVIVIDEKGKFVISLLSGHIGGANEFSLKISSIIDAVPVISTATDLNNKFAVDNFAKKNKLFFDNRLLAKKISSLILDNKKIGFYSDFNILSNIPKDLILINKIFYLNTKKNFNLKENLPQYRTRFLVKKFNQSLKFDYGICISFSRKRIFKNTLWLIPKVICIGVGCKKDISILKFEQFIIRQLKILNIDLNAIEYIASIDLKKDEKAILNFSEKYKITFITYTKDELIEVQGNFSNSDFVKSITGIGNICERCAKLASNNGIIIQKKVVNNGITLALALKNKNIYIDL